MGEVWGGKRMVELGGVVERGGGEEEGCESRGGEEVRVGRRRLRVEERESRGGEARVVERRRLLGMVVRREGAGVSRWLWCYVRDDWEGLVDWCGRVGGHSGLGGKEDWGFGWCLCYGQSLCACLAGLL